MRDGPTTGPVDDIANIVADAPGSERTHGYTQMDDGTTFYWVYDGEVSWREAGYPKDHPVTPPDDVQEATEQWAARNAPFM